MKDILLLFLAFACGGFCGFIAAAMMAAGAEADEQAEFDGGYSATSGTPVRTRIWSDAIKSEGAE